MLNKYFDFSPEELEGLDDNELFKLSIEYIIEFSPNKIVDYINDILIKLEDAIEIYMDATDLTPSDTLAAKNIHRAMQTLTFVEQWIKNNSIYDDSEELQKIISNDEDL